VSGHTGIAAAAQRYFGHLDVAGTRLPAVKEATLLAAWKRPQALVDYGRCLSTSALVTSCQDSSDGLKAGIQSIAKLSDVGFVVEEAALPVADIVAEVAELSDSDLTSLILGDSVDFELVFTAAPEDVPALRDIVQANGFDFVEIGTATESLDVVLRRGDGTTADLPGRAWRRAG
jgi:thiamine-monophosphate kinase